MLATYHHVAAPHHVPAALVGIASLIVLLVLVLALTPGLHFLPLIPAEKVRAVVMPLKGWALQSVALCQHPAVQTLVR